MNINAALVEVAIRVIGGERVRVKLEYKDAILEMMKEKYPGVKLITESESDEQYVYIKKVRDTAPGYTPEDMAKAVHDCNGNPVTSEESVVTGYGVKGRKIPDVTSTQCFAKQVMYTDVNKNEYFIATNRVGGLFMPDQVTEHGRTGWRRCDRVQFNTYLTALKTGNMFEMGRLKNELQID
jgi:hypothetical protein